MPATFDALALRQGYRDEARRPAALDSHQNAVLVAGARGIDRFAHVAGAGNVLAGESEDHVAGFNAGLGRRTVGLRFRHQRAFRFLEAEAVGDVGGDGLDLDADPAAADRALVLELGNYILDGRCRDRERDADAAAGRRIDRRVDAHHLAFGVEGRATGVALVHGRVDLDEIVVRTAADVAAAGRDDAGGHGAAEAERVTDREHPIADPGLALRKLGEREVRTALDLDQRDVGARVGADHLRGKGLAVVGRDFDLVGAIHHVVVGHSIAIGRDEETGTLTGQRPAAATGSAAQARGQAIRSAKAAEEALHRRARLERRVLIVGAVVLGEFFADVDLYRDHRGLPALDDAGQAERPLYFADLVVDLRMRGAAEDAYRTRRWAKAVNSHAQAGHDRSHQRELARREQRTAGLPVGGQRRKIDGAFVHTESPEREIEREINSTCGRHLVGLKMGICA